MAAEDTASLVLSLEAKFDKFEKAMLDAVKVVDKRTKEIEDRFTKMTKVITDKLNDIQGSLVAQAGLIGRFLSTLGPAGIAAAVGVGALVGALNATADAAERVGQKAIALKDFALTTGLTIEQAGGLRKALTALALDADQVQKSFQVFTVQLNELRTRGSGPLVEALQSIDSGLVETVLKTKTTEQAFRVFITALSKMSVEARNAFSRQVGGRGGIGAFAEMAEDVERFFKVWQEGTASAKPKEQVEAIEKAYKEMLAVQKQVAAEKDKIFPTQAYVEAQIALSRQWLALLQEINKRGPGTVLRQAAEHLPIVGPALTAKRAFDQLTKTDLDLLGEGFDDVRRKSELLAEQNKALADGVKKLGEAGTTAAVPAATVQKETDARAALLAKVNAQIVQLELLRRVGGPAFTAEQANQLQKLKLAQEELNVAQNPALTAARIAGQKELNRVYLLQTIAIREQVGVATEEEMRKAKLLEIDKQRAAGIITASEAERAAILATKEAREQYEAVVVRQSNLPGLQRMALDFQNASKQIDQFATAAFGNLENAMVDVITGSKNLSDAFRDMTNAILKDLARMLVRRAFLGPLLDAFLPVAGKMAGGPVSGGTPYIVGERGPELFVPNAAGTIVPNNKLTTAGGVNVVGPTTTVVVQGSADQSTLRAMAQMLDQRDKRFVADVARASAELRRRSVFA